MVSVVVGQATLIIVASSGSMDYGGTVPTITPTYEGLANGDTAPATTADLHHDRHLVEHRGHLSEHLLGRGRPRLHDRLHQRVGHRGPGGC